MSNVVAFKSAENFNTVTFRSNEWKYDIEHTQSYKYGHYHGQELSDFRITANHDRGAEPFESVNLEVYVAGRQSNEHFIITRQDAIALRDMFAQVAATMRD